MLTQILDEYRKSSGVISLDHLSRKLGVERSALDGMLETLVRQGKLREVGKAGAVCGSCHSGACHGCSAHGAAVDMGKAYELVDRQSVM
jgi:hypothetical protein